MSYIGNRPDTNILFYALGIDRFSGTGSQTVFTLSRELGQDLDAQVIVDNVIQEPGASFSYSISGISLTFTEAPPVGANNVQVVYRTQNVVSPYSDVSSEQIGLGSITESKLATSSVTNTKLASNAVTASKINDSAVETSKINNLAVTTGKLADLSVTSDKLAAGSVTSSKIGTGAVGTSQLASSISVTITGGSITGITDLAVADGGTGASNAGDARTNLGLTVANGYQVPTGAAMLWTGGSIPSGWAQCNGSAPGIPNIASYGGYVWIVKT
jgi:hypothetical protein